MRKKLWIVLALTLVIPGFLFTASCAKKAVKEDTMATQQAEDEAAMKAREAAEKTKQEEMARQRALEEERLKEEARLMQEAKDMFLNADIHFEFDSSTLTPEAQLILKKKAEWLQNNPESMSTVEGHCDERGTSEYNLALGDRRATSAKNFLVDLGISASRLTTISYGEERPVDLGKSEEAWAKNRRCHFTIN
ncbi:MAG: peptidoglycan-associated lipoprotein Pal [Desulfobacteraceae bacterium]|nr:peptidoglycan-associated lipoprotein Pal [Desulfobacteraceae bacterium]